MSRQEKMKVFALLYIIWSEVYSGPSFYAKIILGLGLVYLFAAIVVAIKDRKKL